MRLIRLASIGLACFTLCACESMDNQIDYHNMSCTQLAREIGKLEARKERADDDELSSNIGAAFAKDRDAERDYEIDSALAGLTSYSIENELKKLENIYRHKACY